MSGNSIYFHPLIDRNIPFLTYLDWLRTTTAVGFSVERSATSEILTLLDVSPDICD